MNWVDARERLPLVVYEPDGCVNCVLVRYKPEWTPDGGSEYQVSNTVYLHRHPGQITHWAEITPP